MLSQDNVSNVRVIRELYDAIDAGDVEAALANMDQGIEWNEAEHFPYADGNPYIGPQAVLEGVFMRLGTEWEGYTVSAERLLDAGEDVVALGTYSGTYNATGREVRAQFAHVWGLSDGKIVSFQQYTDTKQFADVIS